jgi:photosystem II stability/assembly factor-like uncharacterized protein
MLYVAVGLDYNGLGHSGGNLVSGGRTLAAVNCFALEENSMRYDTRLAWHLGFAALAILATAATLSAQTPSADDVIRDAFNYRNMAPYRVGSWVTDIAVPETPEREHLYTIYVAARNGGVWKSTNNGTTFTPLFDDQPVSSIGAVAVAPSDANIVWVGTGDVSCARSAYYGDGVYKSTDAGRTWKNMGLGDSHHVARIIIHPTNPDVVWVAAMGHLFSTNEERGVFKTTDGGQTWKRVLYIDDKTGAIDLVLDRSNPDILFAAMYQCQRAPWRLFDGGPGSGLHKTTDGGDTWQKLGGGLPEGQIGRIGVDIYQRDPNILYAVIDNRNMRGAPGGAADSPGGDMAFVFEERYEEEDDENEFEIDRFELDVSDREPLGDGQPEQRRGRRGRGRGERGGRGGGGPRPIGGEVYRSDDAGATWRKVNSEGDDASAKAGYSFNVLRISADDPNHLFITGSNLSMSLDGGRTWGAPQGGGRRGRGARGERRGGTRGGPERGGDEGDAQDRRGEGRGRAAESQSGGERRGAAAEIARGGRRGGGGQYRPFARAFGDFRMLWIDQQDPNRIIAGSDGGIYISYDRGRTSLHCLNVQLGEIYALGIDMENPYNVYVGMQDHESWKGPSNAWTGWNGVEHWVSTGTGDGMYNQVDPTDSRWLFNNQEFGSLSRVDQVERTRTRIAPTLGPAGESLRWNWTSPIHLSPHNPAIIYTGSQFLHRSMNRGDDWQVISPDLTTNNPEKISGRGAAIQHCTILTISESPITPGVIWVGTDDGNVQVTRDGGVNWMNVTASLAVAGAPPEAWVSRVFASPHEAGSAFVSMSRLRQDDFRPFLFETADYGATWTPIAGNLPDKSINVVVQDPDNANLLVVGNDLGVFASIDGGNTWSHLKGNMPAAPVHDLVIHPREADVVAGTYGRGVWITNIAPLKELNAETLEKPGHVFAPLVSIRPREGVFGNHRWFGDGFPTTRNAPGGVAISYYLKEAIDGGVEVTVTDAAGETVATLNGPGRAGLNEANWRLDASSREETPPGRYTATVVVGEVELSRPFEVKYP